MYRTADSNANVFHSRKKNIKIVQQLRLRFVKNIYLFTFCMDNQTKNLKHVEVVNRWNKANVFENTLKSL